MGRRKMTKIIRKADVIKERKKVLELEIDYELSSLYQAMQKEDENEVEKCKNRLKEIQEELADLETL